MGSDRVVRFTCLFLAAFWLACAVAGLESGDYIPATVCGVLFALFAWLTFMNPRG